MPRNALHTFRQSLAAVTTHTFTAPARFSTRAHSRAVAPVVIMSSISSTSRPRTASASATRNAPRKLVRRCVGFSAYSACVSFTRSSTPERNRSPSPAPFAAAAAPRPRPAPSPGCIRAASPEPQTEEPESPATRLLLHRAASHAVCAIASPSTCSAMPRMPSNFSRCSISRISSS